MRLCLLENMIAYVKGNIPSWEILEDVSHRKCTKNCSKLNHSRKESFPYPSIQLDIIKFMGLGVRNRVKVNKCIANIEGAEIIAEDNSEEHPDWSISAIPNRSEVYLFFVSLNIFMVLLIFICIILKLIDFIRLLARLFLFHLDGFFYHRIRQ